MSAPNTLPTSSRNRDTNLDTPMVSPSTGYIASEKEPNGKTRENLEGERPSAINNTSGGSTSNEQTSGGDSEANVDVIGQRVVDSEAADDVIGQGVAVSSLVASADGNHDKGGDGHVSVLIAASFFFLCFFFSCNGGRASVLRSVPDGVYTCRHRLSAALSLAFLIVSFMLPTTAR